MGERTPTAGLKAAVDATRIVFDAKTVVVIVTMLLSVGASYHLQRADIDQSLTELATEIQAADARTQLQLSELRAEMTTRAELERVRAQIEADLGEVRAIAHTLDLRMTSIETKLDHP